MKKHLPWLSALLLSLLGSTLLIPSNTPPANENPRKDFDGAQARKYVDLQLEFGPRIPGSAAQLAFLDWSISELKTAGWATEIQMSEFSGHPIKNVIARRGNGSPWIILGAHYDSRQVADHDPDPSLKLLPVPGANDGASGVAILMELANSLPDLPNRQVWLVLFDAEDQGRIPGWDWILGSRAFARSLQEKPDAVVIVDMVGDADLNIHLEKNSTPYLAENIWAVARELGYSQYFLNTPKHSMLDDHTPFLELGIPAVDIIDFDYPYWHTSQDTADKVTSQSLQIVGHTLWKWIQEYQP